MSVKKQKLGEFLFDYLYEQGIENAFGIPGDFVLPTVRYLDNSKINLYTMTHEPSVGFAADCYARSKGLGLAIITYCVGGLNMLNSIACAYAEKSPVIVISGGPSATDRQKDPMIHHKVRTFDSQRRIYEEVTCANTVLLDTKKAAEEIVRVVQAVKRYSRPGYIEVPFDAVDIEIEVPDNIFDEPQALESDKEVLKACIDEITDMINSAEHPVIIADIELHRHKLADLASGLSKKHNIPIAATLMGKSVVRENNPLYLGVYSGAFSEPHCQDYIDNSDCIILLGAFLSDVLLGFSSTKLEREKCIALNTEKTYVRLHTYEHLQLKDILEKLLEADINRRDNFKNPKPVNTFTGLTEQNYDEKIDVESLFNILSTHIEEDDTIVCDTGDALIGAIGIKTATRSHFFADAYYLSMGFAAPASIGAMVANPSSKTFAIIGDGAFQMTGLELSTAAKYKLAPIVIVINNDGYGTQRHIIDGDFNNITMWDYSKTTDLINYGKSVKITTKGELEKALIEARDYNELYFMEVVVPRDNCSVYLRQMGEAIGKLRNPDKR